MNNFIKLIKDKLLQPRGVELIEQEIKLMFNAIALTKNIDDAELLFKNLEDIHFILSKVFFKGDLKVNVFLREFIYDFDRIDDIEVKIFQYKKIKSDTRLLGNVGNVPN